MTVKSNGRLSVRVKWVCRISSIVTILIGSLVLVGWWLNIEVLKSVLPGLPSMKFNTALCFTLSGLSLRLLCEEPSARAQQGKRMRNEAVNEFLGNWVNATIRDFRESSRPAHAQSCV